MGDPELNEEQILQFLVSDVPISPNGIRTISGLVLLACYDRKVTREYMAKMIDHNQNINIILQGLEKTFRLREAMKLLRPNASTPQLDQNFEELIKRLVALRYRIAEDFKAVTECPTTKNTLH